MTTKTFFNSGFGFTCLFVVGILWGASAGQSHEKAAKIHIPELRGALHEPDEWSGDPKYRVSPFPKTYLA